MAVNFENSEIVKDIEARFKTSREQTAALGVWDLTLRKFKSGDPTLNVQTIGSISEKAGWDMVISFTKREN